MIKRFIQALLGLGTFLGLLTLASYVPMVKAQVVPGEIPPDSVLANLTASRIVVTDSTGNLASNGALTAESIPVASGTGTLTNSGISDDTVSILTTDRNFILTDDTFQFTLRTASNLASFNIRSASELLTLNTGGTTTDTSTISLPANGLVLAITTRVTTTITTAVSFSVGDPTTAARFSASAGGMTAGSTRIGIDQWSGAVTTLAAGPSQSSAAAIRITTNANPGAGAIRITMFYVNFTAPSS